MSEKQVINPEGLFRSPAYSHSVSVTGGKTIYVAGQVSLNAEGELVGPGDLRAQADQAFANLKLVLAASGATFTDVVKFGYFVKGYEPSMAAIIREVRSQYLPSDVLPPASTLVGVQSLFRDDLLFEVDAIAVVPK